ncbi:MAG: hypothetical protein AB7O67_05820 [Vicinamibacterales bacterium]
MADADYRKALDSACREWERLSAERTALDRRLTDLQRTIATLSRLCGLEPTVPFGLADGCRAVLRRHDEPLAASRIRDELEAIGFDFTRYSNPLASLHVTLKRLVQAGEARYVPGSPGVSPSYARQAGPRVIVAGSKAEALAIGSRALAGGRRPQRRKK